MTDDLEALFDEISAKRTGATPAPESEAAPAAAAPETQAAPAPAEAPAAAAQDAQPSADATDASGKPMYERLGGIVRLLHDSLRELGYDRALSEAATQITDAQGRLEHIASLTEQAANKVLNTVDQGMPEQEALGKSAKEMDDRWSQVFEGKMSLDEFKKLATESKQFAARVAVATDTEKARLLDIMMAQDFQDITGQLIKKIVGITQKVENELAQLLLDNAPPELVKAVKETPETLMQGPSVNAMGQDDVDNLLDSLGF
jgi:chemotaxis protein CheZ